jgi:hypothetical protein
MIITEMTYKAFVRLLVAGGADIVIGLIVEGEKITVMLSNEYFWRLTYNMIGGVTVQYAKGIGEKYEILCHLDANEYESVIHVKES